MFVIMWDNDDKSTTCLYVISRYQISAATNAARSVQTFKGQGVSKRGLVRSNFAKFYSGDRVPASMPEERDRNGNDGMRTPVQVDLLSQSHRIDPRSRINLRALHTCQKNWKVCLIGEVTDESWDTLWEEHEAVRGSDPPRKKKKRRSGS